MLWLLVLTWLMAAAPSSEAVLELTYREPWENADGQPLMDLAYTTIWYDAGAGPHAVDPVPASSPNGGAWMTEPFSVTRPSKQAFVVQMWVTATDVAGNISVPSERAAVTVPKSTGGGGQP